MKRYPVPLPGLLAALTLLLPWTASVPAHAGIPDLHRTVVDMAAPPSLPHGEPCVSIDFPYTLSGTSNTARVAELRLTIECANANASADSIDLNGHELTLSNAHNSDVSGPNGLPLIDSELTLRNGGLIRSGGATFRFLSITSGGSLTVEPGRRSSATWRQVPAVAWRLPTRPMC